MTQKTVATVGPGIPAPEAERRASTVPRLVVGGIRMLAGLLVLAAICTQIVDQLLADAFVPEEYFSYFTIQTSLMNVVVLVTGGVYALRRRQDTELLSAVRMAIVCYAVVTGSVYAVLLRGIPQEGFIGVQWPNEVIHVVIPVLIAVDWLLAPGTRALAWRRLWLAVSFPLVWAAFTIVRGLLTGWFPYPFLQPDGPGGWGSVLLYILGIAAFVIAVAAVAIGRTRVAFPR